jgi:hypothetical protein
MEFRAANLRGSTNDNEIAFLNRSCSLEPVTHNCTVAVLLSDRAISVLLSHGRFYRRTHFLRLSPSFVRISGRRDHWISIISPKFSRCQDSPWFKIQYASQTCSPGMKVKLSFEKSHAKTRGQSRIEGLAFAPYRLLTGFQSMHSLRADFWLPFKGWKHRLTEWRNNHRPKANEGWRGERILRQGIETNRSHIENLPQKHIISFSPSAASRPFYCSWKILIIIDSGVQPHSPN